MDVDSTSPTPRPTTPEPLPEGEIYLRLLAIHQLLTNAKHYEKAVGLAQQTIEKMQILNRRSMDPIAAKVWYAVERAFELSGKLADSRP